MLYLFLLLSSQLSLTNTESFPFIKAPTDEKKLEFVIPLQKGEEGYEGSVWDDEVAGRARKAMLEAFAVDETASVQATLCKMAERIIIENASINRVSYALPNEHYVPVDMRYLNIDNLTPAQAEVFGPNDAPSGLITATISKK